MQPLDVLAECARHEPDVPSPCVGVCRMDPVRQLCEGCWRTLDEIAAWSRMEDEARREVWRLIGKRLQHRQVA